MARTLRAVGVVLAAWCASTGVSAVSTVAHSRLQHVGADGAETRLAVRNPADTLERSTSDAWGAASTSGLARFGLLEAGATASAAEPLDGKYFAHSRVRWRDELTFSTDLPGIAAGLATVTLVYLRDWAASDDRAIGSATQGMQFRVSGHTFDWTDDWQRTCSSGGDDCGIVGYGWLTNLSLELTYRFLSPDIVEFTFPVLFGAPTRIGVSLWTSAFAQAADVSPTWTSQAGLYWAGVTRVTDTNRNPLEFDVRSGSGTDYLDSYVRTVPEPATILLMTLGLLALARTSRRKPHPPRTSASTLPASSPRAFSCIAGR